MEASNKQMAEDLLREIENSNMSIQGKLKVLEMLDKAFRQYMGVMFLSNEELEANDILFRSM